MNRIYSTVWSEARGTYVVTHEKSKSKGKPSTTRKVVAQAVTAALLALGAGQAMSATNCSASGLITIDGAMTSTCTLSWDDSLLVNSGGSIIAPTSDSGVYIYANRILSIDNKGHIEGSRGIKMDDNSSISGGITNSGRIIGVLSSGITVNDYIGGGIINSGTIQGLTTGVGVYGNIDGGIHNAGLIQGGSTGIHVRGTVAGGIINSGAVQGDSYYGIYAANSNISDGIHNSGVISGADGGSENNAIGIYLSKTNLTGGITNSGTLSVIAYAKTGIYISKSTVGGAINNSGNIQGSYGGIRMRDSTVENIINSGTISGSTQVGLAVNSGARVVGAIYNSGTIQGEGTGIWIDDYGARVSIGITNTGTIQGDSWAGIGIGGDISGGIHNSGLIQGGETGIYVSGTVAGGITNSGNIQGVVGDGIGLDIGSTISGGIINNGLITGNVGVKVYNDDGPYAELDYIANQPSGRIVGTSGVAINLRYVDSLVEITNAGTINGAVNGKANLSNSGLYILPESPSTFSNPTAIGSYIASSISGDYTQGADGILRIGASGASAGEYSTLTVEGTATLQANAKIDVNVKEFNGFGSGGGTLAGVISAGTLVSDGTFNVTDNSVLVDFVGLIDNNDVDLMVIEQEAVIPNAAILDSVLSVSNSPATGAASLLDRLLGLSIDNGSTGNAGMDAVLTNLVANHSGTERQVSNAVSQTLPLLTGGQTAAISGAQHSVSRIVQARQEGQQGRSSGDTFLGDKHVWVKPFGSMAAQDNSNGVTGFNAKTSGIVFGVDSEVQNVNRLGGALAISRTSVNGNSALTPQSSSVDSYQLVVYGSRSLSEATDINFQADIGNHSNKGHRAITFMGSTAQSDYNSLSAHLGAGLAHTLTLNEKTSFTPSVRADYTRIKDGAYQESGAGALNLAVGSSTAEEFIVSADAKLTHKLKERTLLAVNLGAGYDTMNQQASIIAAYAGAPSASFTTQGLRQTPWLVRGGLGVVHTTLKGLELTARYDVEGREGFLNQTVSAKLRWAF